MKKFDLVKLINANKYLDRGLYQDLHGIVINAGSIESDVLFFNETNISEAIIVNIFNDDLIIEKEVLPNIVKNEIKEKLDITKLIKKSKFEKVNIKAYDFVELLVEDNKYASHGIHKGETGCVLEGGVINGKCLVDFSGIDEQGNVYGDCIQVKIKDLKILKNKE